MLLFTAFHGTDLSSQAKVGIHEVHVTNLPLEDALRDHAYLLCCPFCCLLESFTRNSKFLNRCVPAVLHVIALVRKGEELLQYLFCKDD